MRGRRGIWPIAIIVLLAVALLAAVFLPEIPLSRPDNPKTGQATVSETKPRFIYCETTVAYPRDNSGYSKTAYQLGLCTRQPGDRVKITYNLKNPEQADVEMPISPVEIAVLVMTLIVVLLLSLRVHLAEKNNQSNIGDKTKTRNG